jgi:hypothetical protein
MNRIMAPFCGPHKSAGFAGKKPQSPGGHVLWGPQWTPLAYGGAEDDGLSGG